jgi:hypothetical protein
MALAACLAIEIHEKKPEILAPVSMLTANNDRAH